MKSRASVAAMLVVALGAYGVASGGAHGAECASNARGRTACGNGNEGAMVNRNTGNVVTTQKGPYGANTTESSRGGKAVTKNGKGVYTAPGGTTCVRTANGQECR
ncbi:hypothetical protein [Noviherbaspirillum pedocola]|nr:hypothetical protein [Noviherbaspirillum pedocola]